MGRGIPRAWGLLEFVLDWLGLELPISPALKNLYGIMPGYTPEQLISQWKNNTLKMYLLLKKVNFHCHVSLLEGLCLIFKGESRLELQRCEC